MSWDGTIEAGTRYVSRDGREIRIYATDGYGDQPIHGAMPVDRGETSWLSHTWTSGGRFYAAEQLESDCDIVGPWVDPPEPKWRPFRDGEVASIVGRVIRSKFDHNKQSLVTGTAENSAYWNGGWGSTIELFDYWDLGHPMSTWGPCGVLEDGS